MTPECPHGKRFITQCKECAKHTCRHWAPKGKCSVCDCYYFIDHEEKQKKDIPNKDEKCR